jgi:hypothetical protein
MLNVNVSMYPLYNYDMLILKNIKKREIQISHVLSAPTHA